MGNSYDKKEFEDFMNLENHSPSDRISYEILERVRRELEPSQGLVFTKLLMIHVFIGIITMMFCPQFNLSLTNNYELFHFFHRQFGQVICMAICGGIFVGSGSIFGGFILKATEISTIFRQPLLYYFSLSSALLSGFMLLGVETYLSLGAAWICGAAVMGYVMMRLSKKVRLLLRLALV